MIDRIKQLLEWQQLSPTQFADRIGVGRPVVSHILSERNKPSLDVVQRIIAAFPNLSLPWLLSGSGEMLTTSVAPVATAPSSSTPAPAVAPPVVAVPTITDNAAATPLTAPGAKPVRPVEDPPSSPFAFAQRQPTAGAGPGRFRAGTGPRVAEAVATRFVANATRALPTETAEIQPVEALYAAPLPSAAPAPPSASVPQSEFLAPNETRLASPSAPVPSLPTPTISDAAILAQAMGESLGTPGKTIRRIVLFYTDGSFADYKPE